MATITYFPAAAGAGVSSAVAGTGISVSAATGDVTFTNTGVTSIVAGTGISISGATGAVTITNTGPFSADTTVQLNNSTPAAVSAFESIITLPTTTPAAEVSNYVIKILAAGAQQSILTLKPAAWIGPSGGLTISGDVASGGSLTLQSTTHATKGKVYFGLAANTFYDQVNNQYTTVDAVPFLLQRSGAQTISKNSGLLAIGTSDANAFYVQTSNTYRIKIESDGKTGFFGAAAVAQPTVGANVNNVAASGTTGQFDDFTNGTVYATDYANLHATIYQLTRSVAQITVGLRALGLGA
jgi:hypothetical protein